MTKAIQLGAFLMTSTISTAGNAQAAPRVASRLYDNVSAVLRERYYDRTFREKELDPLVARYRPAASATELPAQRGAVEKLLAHIPASHLALLSQASQHYLLDELAGKIRPTFGFQLLRLGDRYFSFFVLEGGPAAEAGVLQWERVVSLDDRSPEQSGRVDYQQKDAHLSEDRDPPIHSLLCKADDEITVVLERTPGETRPVRLRARAYSALEAARASARVLEINGRRVGYLHLWFIHSAGVPELLRELFNGKFAGAEGLLLDLRGRGGNGFAVGDILQVLENWRRPIVALTDRQSRSAKDVLAYEFRKRKLATLVGEATAGAVIPASFAPVGEGMVLMFPSFTLGEYTQKLELKGGVQPHISVERAGPYSAGRDPIFERGQEELAHLMGTTRVRAEAAGSAAAPAGRAAQPAGFSKPGYNLPSSDELIAEMVRALGGEEALRAHAHRTLRGTAELLGLPMKGPFVQKMSAPDKWLVEMRLGDLLVRQGFDGNTAWADNPMSGRQILTGAAADAVRDQAQFYRPLGMKEAYREITAVAVVQFDGKECIEVKLVSQTGAVSSMYVDRATFLIAGTRATVETPVGAVPSTTYFRNYREFDGYRAPSEIYLESSVQRQLIRIESISFEEIPAREYAPPAEAK